MREIQLDSRERPNSPGKFLFTSGLAQYINPGSAVSHFKTARDLNLADEFQNNQMFKSVGVFEKTCN